MEWKQVKIVIFDVDQVIKYQRKNVTMATKMMAMVAHQIVK